MNRCRQCADTNWSALKLLDNRQQQFSVHFVEAIRINLHSIESVIRHFMRDAPVIIDVRIITHASQEPINNAWSAARSTRDFMRAAAVNLDIQDACRTPADRFEVLVWIKVQMKINSKPSAQRRGDQAGARRRPD